MSLPLVKFSTIPTDVREWDRVLAYLQRWYTTDGSKALVDDSATLHDRTSTSFGAMTDRIANNGQAANQQFLNVVSSANSNSVQSQQALSATSGAATSTVEVAAHTLQFGDFLVSYNAGSVAGLTAETEYQIYADDPDYEGGAVTYLATTNAQTAVANNGRYRVGSITTPELAAAGNVSAATSANPIQITKTAHGWATGFRVAFSSMPGDFAVLNTGSHLITLVDANNFVIPVNGGLFAAYTSGGTVTKVSGGGYGGGGGGGSGPLP